MKISVAAVPYFWSRDTYLDFYRELARSPVDIVYLGETVCAKRRTMSLQDWIDIALLLRDAGKQVVLSTLTLIEAESELKALRRIVEQADFLIEANDLAAVQIAGELGRPFAAGCAINIYNSRSLGLYQASGMKRWCVPVELGKDDIGQMIVDARAMGVEIEYQVFGRLPLAYSARCFTARHHDLPKDSCEFKCLQYEQGIPVATQEQEGFIRLNGIQTQSDAVNNLLDHWQELEQTGVDILRIVPVAPKDTLQALDYLRKLVAGHPGGAFSQELENSYEFCNGYWLQQEGIRYVRPE